LLEALISRPVRPKLSDVAKLAGVSPAVVSRVVNRRTNSTVRIGPATEQRVWAAVRQIGYVANPVAQRLASGKNRLLGVFTHEAVFPVDQRSFYHPFLVGIEREAEERGYDLLLFTSTHGSDGRRSIFRDGANRLLVASGAVLLGWAENRDEIRSLAEAAFPFSYVGRREIPGLDVPYASADYATATGEVVDHLVRLGHRRLTYVGLPVEREASLDRVQGYRSALARWDLLTTEPSERRLRPAEITAEEVRRWTREGVTAFVVEDDVSAESIAAVAAREGLRIPDDVSLAVLGDPMVHTEPTSSWTTFHIPRFEMGREAAALSIDLIERPLDVAVRHVVLPCTFAPGATTGPAREVSA
jgi:DNA-binding LacI/PurR family transcriptional regulator